MSDIWPVKNRPITDEEYKQGKYCANCDMAHSINDDTVYICGITEQQVSDMSICEEYRNL